MKKITLAVLLAVCGFMVQAQRLEKAKDLLGRNRLEDAKTEIEKVLAVEKNQNVSEAWYTKAKIYLALGKDSTTKATVPDYREVAYASLQKYFELEKNEKDDKKRHILLTLEGNQPLVDIYGGYSKDAASYYNAGNYNDALANFKKCLEVFSLMAEKGLVNVQLDTTTTLYTGISAEKANKPDEAATYYAKIADSKAKGEGFVEIYKWLADHYRRKDDTKTAIKYSTLGREVYPEDPFWTGFELEMLRDQGTKDELFAKYEQVIKENPDNHLYLFNYGVELYRTAYTEDITKRPANSKELIDKARESLKKAVAIDPNYANAYMVLGQIAYNEGVDMNNENKEIRPQGGVKLTAEQLQKKEDLRKAVVVKFDEAIPYFKKVDEILDSQGKLKMDDKETLKGALDLMIIANEEKAAQLEQKKNDAERKKNAADMKKYEAELEKVQGEIAAYTDKFNNVDKKH